MRGIVDAGLRRFVPLVAGVVAASAAFAANVVQQVQYRGQDDSFAVLTTVEGYTPEEHKSVVELYGKRQQLVFIPVDFAVRMFEENLKTPEAVQNPHWTGYTRSEDGQLVAGTVKAPIGSSELTSKITTRPGQLFVSADLLSYYQETIVPGTVVDEMLSSYRGPLMDKAAIEKEIARRDAGETMKFWADFRGLQQDNPLEFMDFVSLRMLLNAANGNAAKWTRSADVAECLVPMIDEDARDMKRACEWWLAKSRRDHSYQGQLQRGFAAAFQISCHLTPVNGQGLRITVNMPESMDAFSSQARIQSDTRGGEILRESQAYGRFENYDSMRQLLSSKPEVEVNWIVRDRAALSKMYKAGDLRFSTTPVVAEAK